MEAEAVAARTQAEAVAAGTQAVVAAVAAHILLLTRIPLEIRPAMLGIGGTRSTAVDQITAQRRKRVVPVRELTLLMRTPARDSRQEIILGKNLRPTRAQTRRHIFSQVRIVAPRIQLTGVGRSTERLGRQVLGKKVSAGAQSLFSRSTHSDLDLGLDRRLVSGLGTDLDAIRSGAGDAVRDTDLVLGTEAASDTAGTLVITAATRPSDTTADQT